MDKLKMQSPNLVDANIVKIAELFPNCITETKDENGILRRAVDFDLLRQELSANLVEGPRERYTLSWPGKNEAILTANAPIAKTLRPCVEESVDFENTKNIYIEGDNLDVLKLLQETYLNKIKMIYFDPPYNTGKDFIFEDDFSEDIDTFLKRSNQKDEEGNRLVANNDSNGRFHSDWLSMMYSRVKLARNLLSDDGVIFISIDENEVTNLQKICDEIFGEKNHVATLSVINNMKGRNDKANVATCHEYLIVYSKGNYVSHGLPLTEDQLSEYKYVDQDGARYALRDLRKRGRPDRREDRPNMFIPIYYNKNNGHCFLERISQEDIEILPKRGDGSDGRWRWGKDKILNNLMFLHPRYSKKNERWDIDHRVYLNPNATSDIGDEEADDGDQIYQRTSKTKSFWWGGDISTDVANREFKKLFPNLNPDYPKSPYFIERLLQMSVRSNDIVLDFFSGYATTAIAIMQINAEDGGNRNFIMVQLPESCDENSDAYKAGYKTIAEIGKERIRRAGKKIKEEWAAKQQTLLDTPSAANPTDIGFRVFKVDTSNMKDVYYTPDELKQDNLELFKDHIKPDRRPEDLLFQVFLDWGLDLTKPITKETIDGKTVFIVDTNDLLACFDSGITEELVKKLAKHKPLRAVFRDDAFGSDSVKINVEQIFKLLSPGTEVKSI